MPRVAFDLFHIQYRDAAGFRRHGRDVGRLHVGGFSFAFSRALRFVA